MEMKKDIYTEDETAIIKNIAEVTTGTVQSGEVKNIDLVYILPEYKSDYYLCINSKDESNKVVFKITDLK